VLVCISFPLSSQFVLSEEVVVIKLIFFSNFVVGLLDVPICAVNDDGYFSSPKYSLQFPPSAFDTNQVGKFRGKIPVNAINVNSQLHPINTVTGLQYFTGLNSYPWREKAVPKIGLGK